ncbi:hypothetical protein P43SY_009929 [Pythium insidiosum]|uniref:Uncharacterized protein n=1 Tax=Pythium insidiosum TaxID=114742 RepID=A0AAD5QA55_PYTIN|nr:hypothetical protein P43SY_009929 [Pythium insidiosum]
MTCDASQSQSQSQTTPEVDEETRVLLHDERSCIFETRVERAAKCRDRGSAQFKAKDVLGAVQWYERALFHVDFDEGTWFFEDVLGAVQWYERALFHVDFDEGTWFFEFMDKHRDAVNQVRLPVHLNLAMCFLLDATRDLIKAIEHADAALAIEPDNAKALYRCGKAHLLNDNLDAAHDKLKRAAQRQPQDKNIRELLSEKRAAYKAKEKERWGGRLLNAPTEAASDDDDENDDRAPSASASNSAAPTPAAATGITWASSWRMPLVVMLLAMLTGVLLVYTRQDE